MFPENRRRRPIPWEPGLGGRGFPLSASVPVPLRTLRPLEKWESPLPSRRKHIWRLAAHAVLTGLVPRMRRGLSLFFLTPASLCRPVPRLSVPHFYPRAKLRTW